MVTRSIYAFTQGGREMHETGFTSFVPVEASGHRKVAAWRRARPAAVPAK